MGKLTFAAAEKLKVRGITQKGRGKRGGKARTRLEYHDGSGLYLIVQKSGAKSWAHKWKRNGRSAKYTFATYDAKGSPSGTPKEGDPMNLAEARAFNTQVKLQLNRGVDPVAERRTASVKGLLTGFTAAARDYVEQQCRDKKRSRTWWKIARTLGLDYAEHGTTNSMLIIKGGLADRWRDRPVMEITRRDVHAVVDEAATKAIPGRRAKNRGRSNAREREMINALGGMFKWLLKRELVASLPTSGLDREPSGERNRTLDADELRRLWAALPDSPLGIVVKVMMLTGARVGEAAGMRWSELGEDAWTIPAERSKNKREHAVPLAPAVRELIKSVNTGIHGGDLVFTTNGKRPVSGFSKLKARVDAHLKFSKPWRLHDIRRTVATMMGEKMGVEPHIVEEVLGHVTYKAGVAGLYNRATYEARKKKALERWAARVEEIISKQASENVTEFARVRA